MAIECPAADGSSAKTQKFSGQPPMCIDTAKSYTATMVTNKGTLTIALDPLAAALTVHNFRFRARSHYHYGVPLHRTSPRCQTRSGHAQGPGPARACRTCAMLARE